MLALIILLYLLVQGMKKYRTDLGTLAVNKTLFYPFYECRITSWSNLKEYVSMTSTAPWIALVRQSLPSNLATPGMSYRVCPRFENAILDPNMRVASVVDFAIFCRDVRGTADVSIISL